jgi:C_GCAxxG_C_C family probable redox protein
MTVQEASMKGEDAVKVFKGGFNCAQGVFVPFAEEYGLSVRNGRLVASSFGAGMGRTQETCGAVTGALMAIGLKYGFAEASDQGRKDLALAKTKEFLGLFEAEFGSSKCRDLLPGIDLNSDEGQRLHKELNQRELICAKCVEFAARTVESL